MFQHDSESLDDSGLTMAPADVQFSGSEDIVNVIRIEPLNKVGSSEPDIAPEARQCGDGNDLQATRHRADSSSVTEGIATNGVEFKGLEILSTSLLVF